MDLKNKVKMLKEENMHLEFTRNDLEEEVKELKIQIMMLNSMIADYQNAIVADFMSRNRVKNDDKG